MTTSRSAEDGRRTRTGPIRRRRPSGWLRGNPAATSSSGAKQLSGTPSGQIALVTGAAAGISANANDLDGRTTARSPAIDVPPGTGQRLTFAYVFAHDARSSTSDHLQAIIERSDGTKVGVFVVFGGPVDVDGAWRTASISMDRFAGSRDPHPVRGRGRRLEQSRRGRGRRRPDHPRGLISRIEASSPERHRS